MTNKINANRYKYLGEDKIEYHALNHNIDIMTRWSGSYYYFVSMIDCMNCDLPNFPYRLSKYDKTRLVNN